MKKTKKKMKIKEATNSKIYSNLIENIQKEKQFSFNIFRNKRNGDILIIESFIHDVSGEIYKITKHHLDWYQVVAVKSINSVHLVIDDFYESLYNWHKKRKIFLVENIYTFSNATLIIDSIYTKQQVNEDIRDFILDVEDNLRDDIENPEEWYHADTLLVNTDKKDLKPGVWGI